MGGCPDLSAEGETDSGADTGIQLPGSSSGAAEGRPPADGESGDASGSSNAGSGPGSGPGSDGDPDSSGAPVGLPTCNEETIQLTVEPPQIMLLLDKSYSMIEFSWDHDDDPTTPLVSRWNSLYHVVDALTHDLEDHVELGMVLFPSASVPDNGTATACMVDPEPGAPIALHNAAAIVGALPGPASTAIFGGTPISGGMAVVLEHLEAIADGRPQAVILVTDGAANCMAGTSGMQVFTEYDQGLAPMVAGAFTAGVPTYVVGVDIVDAVGIYPQDNPFLRLGELAQAGGVPRVGGGEAFYNTSDELQLIAALDEIVADIGCTFTLSVPAHFVSQVSVQVAGMAVPRVDACGPDGVGWRYLEAAAPYHTIELCAVSCGLAQAESSLDLDYACPPAG